MGGRNRRPCRNGENDRVYVVGGVSRAIRERIEFIQAHRVEIRTALVEDYASRGYGGSLSYILADRTLNMMTKASSENNALVDAIKLFAQTYVRPSQADLRFNDLATGRARIRAETRDESDEQTGRTIDDEVGDRAQVTTGIN